MTDEQPTADHSRKKRRIWIYVGIVAVVLLSVGVILPGGGDESELCDTMTHAQIDFIMTGSNEVDSSTGRVLTIGLGATATGVLTHGDGDGGYPTWKGSGDPVVTEGLRAASSSTGVFTHVEYLRIDSEDDDLTDEVFVFASLEDFVQGADSPTRRFFTWGHTAANGSPAADMARDAVNNAPICMNR